LVQAAHRIGACLRASDTVARLAGDEFAVLLPGLDEHVDAEHVARKVLTQLAQPFKLNGHEVFISASIGAVVYPDNGLDPASLVRCADQAMYHAKNAGRNELRFYNKEMNAREADRLDIGTRLRAALEHQEFTLVYQPRVDLTTGRISGMEALLRWTHPERGPISPAEFVPVLEDTGLIIGVGEWVLRQVAQQVVQWQAMGLKVPGVAVNLSARQFASSEFDAQVRKVLTETGVSPSLLEFELTESMLMHDPAQAVATLEHFRTYGLRLSVDDFGTGYSSLSYLRRFPLDALKVDSAFVRDLATDADDMAIALAIISMAHSLKLKVVAEGVETIEQLDLLADAGCDEIQGFYFSQPVPAQQIEQMLRDGLALRKEATDDAQTSYHWRMPKEKSPSMTA
jgi:predicted signal transduction protein with EAL and GGDEF domain